MSQRTVVRKASRARAPDSPCRANTRTCERPGQTENATPDPEHPGKFLRDHHKPGNREQHAAFLEEVECTPHQKKITDWFKTLPLWLDLGGIRVVHACWHQASIDLLQKAMGSGQRLTDEMIVLGSRKGHPIYEALETVCKGPEVELPAGISFKDKEGKVRTEVRVRWWQEDLSTYRKACHMDMATDAVREASRSHASDSPMPGEGREPELPGQTKNTPPADMEMIPDVPMPAEWTAHKYSGPPVIFGHYWFHKTPNICSARFACVDYSVANGGPLVAYRWDGEEELTNEKLAWVK